MRDRAVHRPSRNARTSRSNAFGLSTLEACDALLITTRRQSLSALPSPSGMWWKDAGDRSPATGSVGALPRRRGARMGALFLDLAKQGGGVVAKHPPSEFWRPVPTARSSDHVNCELKTLDLAPPNSFGPLCVERAERDRRRRRSKTFSRSAASTPPGSTSMIERMRSGKFWGRPESDMPARE